MVDGFFFRIKNPKDSLLRKKKAIEEFRFYVEIAGNKNASVE